MIRTPDLLFFINLLTIISISTFLLIQYNSCTVTKWILRIYFFFKWKKKLLTFTSESGFFLLYNLFYTPLSLFHVQHVHWVLLTKINFSYAFDCKVICSFILNLWFVLNCVCDRCPCLCNAFLHKLTGKFFF